MRNTLLLILFLLASCAAFSTEQNKSALVVYAVTSAYAKIAAQAFTDKYGIPVRVITMRGNGTTLSRIQSEQASPKADIWFGGSLGAHAQAASEGLLSPYQSRHYDALKDEFKNPLGDHTVQSIYAGILVFAINKDFLASKGLAIPASWRDLTKPVYKGLIGLRNPVLSGTGYTMLLSLVTLMGEEQAFKYIAHLYRHAARVGTRQLSSLRHRRSAISILFLHDYLFAEQNDPQLDFVIPSEGTSYEIGGLSLIAKRPNIVAARQFVDFILSPSQQKSQWQSTGRYPVRYKVDLGKEALIFDNLNLIKIDFAWAGKHRKRLLHRFTQVTNNTSIEN